MSGKRYVCRVLREFGSLGPSGLVLHNVGDEVVRDTEPADATHLEVVGVEDAPQAGAPQLVVNPASEAETVKAAAVAGSGDAAPAPTPARKRAQAATG